jgi:hypothetical protein
LDVRAPVFTENKFAFSPSGSPGRPGQFGAEIPEWKMTVAKKDRWKNTHPAFAVETIFKAPPV